MVQVLAATTGPSGQSPFVLTDFWQKVTLAVLAAVLGFASAYLLERRKEKREPTKRLTYDIQVRSGISAIPSDLQDRIRVLYHGSEVTGSLYEVECVLTNRGNRVVKDEFVRFTFADHTTVLDDLPDETEEFRVTEVAEDRQEAQRRYCIGHLERGQTTYIRFIVTSAAPPHPKLTPYNEEGDVAFTFTPGNVARVAEDVEHLRDLTVILLLFWILPTTLSRFNFFGGFINFVGDLAAFAVGLVLLILSLPHLYPVGRVVTGVAQRYLSADRDRGISVEGTQASDSTIIIAGEGSAVSYQPPTAGALPSTVNSAALPGAPEP